ncbi:MAG: tol-pal system protein YbgF [Burkholderiales bacterium]|nr:tol-pal system protein YbgF [Burkholderiales bacterium]
MKISPLAQLPRALRRAAQSAAIALPLALSLVPSAHAGLLEDDEARKAILELRGKVDVMRRELGAQIDTKSDKSASVDLINQNEQLRQEIARLRGQIEVLSNELANAQRRQKDFYVDLDSRLRKLEPQKVVLDGKEASVEPSEQKSFDNAQQLFKSGEYKQAAAATQDFIRRYPDSAYIASALYTLGNAYFAQRDCKSALVHYQSIVKNYSDSPKAPDAMLSIASCHTELKEKIPAKKTLEALVSQYPDSAAAQTARERLMKK